MTTWVVDVVCEGTIILGTPTSIVEVILNKVGGYIKNILGVGQTGSNALGLSLLIPLTIPDT